MISNQEFQQKLRAGQIHEALSLVMQDAIELDITTRLTEDIASSQSDGSEYLRTKINFLTGNVQNEVSENVLTDSINYLRLQKLHTDRVVSSHRLVRDYLQQIEAILTVLPTTSSVGVAGLDLTDSNNLPTITAVSPPPDNLPDPVSIGDDDIDLSIDSEGEVWEEWVEDEDFTSDSVIPHPRSTLPELPLSERAEHLVRRPLNPLEVKPVTPRSTSISEDIHTHWNKFAPEYIGIDTDSQPPIVTDVDRMDKLLADLDI
jgi:hypothetical protein